MEIIPVSTWFENHRQPAKQTAESSNKSTKDIKHCLERGISRIFVSTLAFACFPMSFRAKCQVNWCSDIIAHCVASKLNFLTILEKFAKKFSKGGYIFIPN